MNPHTGQPLSPTFLIKSLLHNRGLIASLVQREVIGRYRGSMMGLLWSFFNPMLMLAVYTFVFSVVFKARWLGGSESKTEFALVLFSGLIFFNVFAECINRAPSLVVGNVSYVKKVIFPLEVLPIITLGSALFHFMISFLVWLLFYLIFFGIPPVTLCLMPLVMLPLLIFTCGVSWFLAALSVFLRDIGQVVGVLTTVLLFLSPIFFPIAALPEQYHVYMRISPLTYIIEAARDVMIWGNPIVWTAWLKQMAISAGICWLGFAWFQKTRKGFSDVL